MAQSQQPERPGLKQEAFAIVGIFLAIFLLLAVYSYLTETEGNWCGDIGQLVAQILVMFTGVGAYLLVGLVCLLSCLFFSPQMSFERLPQVTLGLTGSVVSFCGLLSSFTLRDEKLLDTGGFLGRTVYTLLHSFIGGPGTLLVLSLIFLVSLMLSTQFSPYQLVTFLLRTIRALFSGLRNLFVGRRDRRAEKMAAIKSARATIEPRSPKRNGKQPAVDQQVHPPGGVPVVKELAQASPATKDDDDFALVPVARGDWKLPPLSILSKAKQQQTKIDKEVYYGISKQLEQKLKNFGVSGKVIGISPGPVVTTYEYSPAPGVKINKIVGLADDLALGLKAPSVRVVGSVPGKAALGIEIPNADRQIVYLRELLSTDVYRKNSSKLTIALGLDAIGTPTIANLAKMPHLLIAGATGAGKSVAINTIIASILYNATPEEVRFLMIDPKRIELSGYEGIPHLLHPVVVDPRLASRALQWAVREMERRYKLLEEAKVKSFDSYNESAEEKMPYVVIIVDELADLMMVASKDVETCIARLAQMARAAGMHLILATQRPSVDVLTGLIKANFPTRISFKVSSKVDSRTIIDSSGAEHLLGAGDMLYMPPGSAEQLRVHGAFISEEETANIVEFLQKQGSAHYDDSILEEVENENGASEGGAESDFDEKYDEAVAIVCESGQASISMVQRRLRIGYNRAARIIEMMEKEGIVGPADGAKPREILARQGY